MQEKLIVYLHQDETASAAIGANGVVHSIMRGDWDEIGKAALDRNVIVVVPGEDVLLTSVQLPKMLRSRLLQAIPYALEEQLADDVEALHFAIGKQQEDGHVPVLVVAHKKLQRWLTLLSTHHINPSVMVPATLALDFERHAWHVLLAEQAIVRMQVYAGFACGKNQLNEWLIISLQSYEAPQYIYLHNYTEEPCELTLPSAVIKQTNHSPQDLVLDLAKKHLDDVPTVNLLQGTYASKHAKFAQKGKLIRAIVAMGVAWSALLFLYPAVSYFLLENRLHNLEGQITEIYQRHFPHAMSLVAPKLRMEEKIKELSSLSGENHVLTTMAYIAKALASSANVKIKRIDFQNGSMMVELSAATSEEFEAFTDLLNQKGLTVKQQNATLANARVEATLLVG